MTKTYTVLPLKVGGDAFTETMWDTHIRDNINNLLVPACCILTHSTTQSINNAVNVAVNFDTEVVDNDAMHSTVSNTDRINTPTAGVYVVVGWIQYAGNVTGQRYLYLNRTSTITLVFHFYDAINNAGYGTDLSTSIVHDAGASDYFHLEAFQTSGGALNLISGGRRFSAMWVGKTS